MANGEVAERAALERHLEIAHGYRDQVDASPEAMEEHGSYGIVRMSHPVWTLKALRELHEDDHNDHPETGTPVKGQDHQHGAPR